MAANVARSRVEATVRVNDLVDRYARFFLHIVDVLSVDPMKLVLIIQELLKVVTNGGLVFVTLVHELFEQLVERLRIFLCQSRNEINIQVTGSILTDR